METMESQVPFQPLFARVLLEREDKEKIGNIIIPDTAKSRYCPAEGKIVAVGDTVAENIQQLVGKVVMFAKFAGDWLEIDGKKYFICQDEDILGVKA